VHIELLNMNGAGVTD